jgi:hypothetical protein
VVALHVLLGDGVRGAVDGDVDAVSDLLHPFVAIPALIYSSLPAVYF